MSDIISQFIEHCAANECEPSDPAVIIGDNVIRSYHIAGDRAGQLKGGYCLSIEGDFAFGWCLNRRIGTSHGWHSKPSAPVSAEAKAAMTAKAKAAKAELEATRAAMAAKAAQRAQADWDAASPTGTTPYLSRKGVGLNGARISGDNVIIPARQNGKITSVQTIAPDGSKKFTFRGDIAGSYFTIATAKDSLDRIIICEGFATGCTIRQVTGCPVIVAFNAGNLKPVAVHIRSKYPDAEIIIGGDNDQWTKRPDGTPWNPGVEKALEASRAIGDARVIYPQPDPLDPERPTDWNDMGAEATAAAFNTPVIDYDHEPMPDDYYPDYDYDHHAPPMPEETPAPAAPEPEVIEEKAPDRFAAINPLGCTPDGIYYFYPIESGHITALTASSLGSMQTLYRLAPRHYWDELYTVGGQVPTDRQITGMASAELMAACHRIGYYSSEKTRGRGVWIDNGKVLINTGDRIIFQGKECIPARFRGGEFIYESGPRIITTDHTPLLNAEANEFREISRMLEWKRKIYADLLCGWCVIAPICGALEWRPHIFITGPSNAGKSTVMDNIVKKILRDVAFIGDGGTTEPGVRSDLQRNAQPYIIDESESEGEKGKRTTGEIIALARRSSSGASQKNFNARYIVRSSFCFSAINPALVQQADESRVSVLSLVRNTRPDSVEHFDRLKQRIKKTLTHEYAARMIARTIENLPTLLENIETFTRAAKICFKNPRAGDQIGPLLAGAYLLTRTTPVTLEAAKEWIEAQDWSWHKETVADADHDSRQCLMKITTSRIRYDIDGLPRESSIGDLIDMTASPELEKAKVADKALLGYGIKVGDGYIAIANNSTPLQKIMSDSPWISWKPSLERIEGAKPSGKTIRFANGHTSKAIMIPISILNPTDQPQEPEPSIYDGPTDWDSVIPEEMF